MKLICFFLLFVSAIAHAKPIPKSLTPEQVKFSYKSFEGDKDLKCFHEYADEFKFDWNVTCKDQSTFFKLFRVHLSLSQYSHPTAPQTTYEVLYWVTDKTTNQVYGNGSSLWLNTKNKSEFHSLTMGQSVDADTAGLYLEITE